MKEQPKDYEEFEKVPTFPELFEETYKELSIFEKVIYHLQNYILLVIPLALIVGYIAGVYFGK